MEATQTKFTDRIATIATLDAPRVSPSGKTYVTGSYAVNEAGAPEGTKGTFYKFIASGETLKKMTLAVGDLVSLTGFDEPKTYLSKQGATAGTMVTATDSKVIYGRVIANKKPPVAA